MAWFVVPFALTCVYWLAAFLWAWTDEGVHRNGSPFAPVSGWAMVNSTAHLISIGAGSLDPEHWLILQTLLSVAMVIGLLDSPRELPILETRPSRLFCFLLFAGLGILLAERCLNVTWSVGMITTALTAQEHETPAWIGRESEFVGVPYIAVRRIQRLLLVSGVGVASAFAAIWSARRYVAQRAGTRTFAVGAVGVVVALAADIWLLWVGSRSLNPSITAVWRVPAPTVAALMTLMVAVVAARIVWHSRRSFASDVVMIPSTRVSNTALRWERIVLLAALVAFWLSMKHTMFGTMPERELLRGRFFATKMGDRFFRGVVNLWNDPAWQLRFLVIAAVVIRLREIRPWFRDNVIPQRAIVVCRFTLGEFAKCWLCFAIPMLLILPAIAWLGVAVWLWPLTL